MSERLEFCSLLDRQKLPEMADAIFVLRNWDEGKTKERLTLGLKLLLAGKAPVIVISNDTNTHKEMQRLSSMVDSECWTDIIMVTHRSHSYRAVLTALGCLLYDMFDYIYRARVYCATVPDTMVIEEFVKIQEYQKIGHLAQYSEGIRCLRSQMKNRI